MSVCKILEFFLLWIWDHRNCQLLELLNVLLGVLNVEHDELDEEAHEWEEVVVDHNVEIVDEVVPQVHQNVEEWLLPWDWCVLSFRFLYSLVDLLECVLIFANSELEVLWGTLDLLREVLWEHVINLDDETEGNEWFDNHTELKGLTDGKDKDTLCEEWGDHLHWT